MKVLIIRFSSIGDIVLTTPVIRCLKEQKDCEIHYLTKYTYRQLLAPNPYIHTIWSFKESLDEVIPQLKNESFDYIIDLHKNIRSAFIKRKLNVKSFSFHKANIEKWMMVNLKVNKLPKKHIVDRYMETVSSLGVKSDGKGLDFHITDQQEQEARNFILNKKVKTPFIIIAIGTQYATKTPQDSFFIELCQKVNKDIVLIGGPNEQTKGNDIAKNSGIHVSNAAGVLSIGGSAALIQVSECVITPDTGMMHIAAALQKNIISIWGNTIPEFGMSPYMEKQAKNQSVILENKEITCRPCSKIGYSKCPKKHFDCMAFHRVSQVIKVLNQGNFNIKG